MHISLFSRLPLIVEDEAKVRLCLYKWTDSAPKTGKLDESVHKICWSLEPDDTAMVTKSTKTSFVRRLLFLYKNGILCSSLRRSMRDSRLPVSSLRFLPL